MEREIRGRGLGLGRTRLSGNELENTESYWVLNCGLVAPVGTTLGDNEWQWAMLS